MNLGRSRYISIGLTAFIGLFSSNMIDKSMLNTNKITIFAIGTIIGILWGIVITNEYITSFFNRSHFMTQILLLISTFSFCLLSGGSLFGMMSYSAIQNNPIAILQFMKPPIGGGFVFFVLFNTLMELIFFPLLMNRLYNYSNVINRMISISCGIYYLSRAWTYLYFAPIIVNIFIPMASQDIITLDIKLENQIYQWIQLSWLRCIADIISSFILLLIIIEYNITTSVINKKSE